MFAFTADHTRPVFKHDDGTRNLSHAELMKEVRFKLSETDTMWLLEMPSISIMNDSDEALEIVKQNTRHEEVIPTHFDIGLPTCQISNSKRGRHRPTKWGTVACIVHNLFVVLHPGDCTYVDLWKFIMSK